MKSKRNRTIGLGILCALLVAASAWYTVTYNEARFLAPMEMSDYVFRVQDLPMIGSGLLLDEEEE